MADIFDANPAELTYRGATPMPQTLETLNANAGSAIDALCFRTWKMTVCERGIAAPNGGADRG